MTDPRVTCVTVPTHAVIPDEGETTARLMTAPGCEVEAAAECRAALESAMRCRFAYRLVPVNNNGGSCDLGFGEIRSKGLCRALEGCDKAYILGVTLGLGVDRLLAALAVTSPAREFITDALASAAVEGLCEYADRQLRGEGQKPMRFSPGYGDMPLEWQPRVLEALDARATLGITLNKALLMTPVKSITAILGVQNDN